MKFWFKRGAQSSEKANKLIRSISREQVEKIAVIRHAALGDMVLTRGFLIELRKAFKNATITLSISSNYTRGVPDDLVDRLHVVHGSDNKDVSFSERKKRFKELGHQNIIFDLAATNRSFMTCFFNTADLKVGFPYRSIQSYIFYDMTVTRSDLHFEVDDMLSMLHAMGVKTSCKHTYNMPGEKLERDKPYVIYFAGASVPSKCWPTENFRQLIETMSNDYPEHDHLLLEGIMEWEKSTTILGDGNTKTNIGSITSDEYDDTVSLLKGANLVVANDTGIRNLAVVCETPTVGIFFDTYPFRYWPRDNNHEIVLPDGEGVPPVEEVRNACLTVLQHNSRK